MAKEDLKVVKNRHIGAYGIIIEDGKIVLVRKSRGGYMGKLDLPGGGIEHTESTVIALHREILEEVGVKVLEEKLFDVFSNNINWQKNSNEIEDLQHLGIIYQVKILGEIKKGADGLDSLGSEWYDINNLRSNELTPFARIALEKLGYKLK